VFRRQTVLGILCGWHLARDGIGPNLLYVAEPGWCVHSQKEGPRDQVPSSSVPAGLPTSQECGATMMDVQ